MINIIGARRDALTNFYARDALYTFINELIGAYAINRVPFSVLLLDLDHFKVINDKHGHMMGDDYLRHLANSIHQSLLDMPFAVFRYGGDEFILVVPGKSGKDALKVAQLVQKYVHANPFNLNGHPLKQNFSAGLVTYPRDAKTLDDMINKADKAMYFCKRHSRGDIAAYSQLGSRSLKRFFKLVFVILLTALFIYLFWFFYGRILSTDSPKNDIPGVSESDEKTLDEIYFKSGRVIRGLIISENADRIELMLVLPKGGAGKLGIEKYKIERIVRSERSNTRSGVGH